MPLANAVTYTQKKCNVHASRLNAVTYIQKIRCACLSPQCSARLAAAKWSSNNIRVQKKEQYTGANVSYPSLVHLRVIHKYDNLEVVEWQPK